MSQIERIMIYGLKRGDFYSGCGGLSMDASHRLVYLNTWFLDGGTGTGWGGFRGVVLLEEVYHSKRLSQFFFLTCMQCNLIQL